MHILLEVRTLVLSCAAVLSAQVARADFVRLKSGDTVEGRVVHESAAKVVVRVGSRDREIARDDVAEVQSRARNLRKLLERWEQSPAKDATTRLELARAAKLLGLDGEARLFALGALALDPTLAAAHEICGHEIRGDAWHVREGKKRVPFAELHALRSDWSDAWRLSTTHYELRTNLPLDQAFAAALECELLYRAFFDWLGEHVELYEVVEPMVAQVHADSRSYPGTSDRKAFFSTQFNALYIDASEGFQPAVLAHEGTHGLLHNTAEYTRSARGTIPAWVDEGLADSAMAARQGELGRARYDWQVKAAYYYSLHAQARDPYDLSRVLTLGTEDFSISSHIALAYAQSYTLVQFCWSGDDGAHRAGFFEYLRRCYAGRSSMTEFKEALGIRGDEFEVAWHAFAAKGP